MNRDVGDLRERTCATYLNTPHARGRFEAIKCGVGQTSVSNCGSPPSIDLVFRLHLILARCLKLHRADFDLKASILQMQRNFAKLKKLVILHLKKIGNSLSLCLKATFRFA